MEHFWSSGIPWRIFNFSVFVGILFYTLRKPVALYWKKRTEVLANDMEEARRLRREAAQKVLDLEKRVDHLHEEASALIRSLKEEGEREKVQLLADAEVFVKKLKESAQRIIDQEVRRSQEQLKRQTVQLATELAERLIREKITSQDQVQLGQKFLKDLEGRL